jgi:hypothetical protein
MTVRAMTAGAMTVRRRLISIQGESVYHSQ